MKIDPSESPVRGDDTPEMTSDGHEGDSRAGLPDLIRQREEFADDVARIEAALAQGAEDSPGLYERLLRYRRISGKLENRIQLVRIQQKRHAAQ